MLYKSGVSLEILEDIKSLLPEGAWGFGDIKPWTEDEQINAIKNRELENQSKNKNMLFYEKLEESLH